MVDNADSDPLDAKVALDHAWNWFVLHAGQRMQSFHFFLITMAFLFAAYGSLLEKNRWAALFVALFGAWVSHYFNKLERRNKQLVKAGEAALRPLQSHLARRHDNSAMTMLESVDVKAPGSASYSTVIDRIQHAALAAFISGALYAVALAVWKRDP